MAKAYNNIQSSCMNERMLYIDNLRVIACFLVLLTHSTMPVDRSYGFWSYAISFMSSPSPDLFIAISGTVLLPVNYGFRNFYKRRFIRLLPPLIIWSILGLLLFAWLHDMPWNQILTTIVNIPFHPANGVYWFVYVLVGLYLLAPFISPWLKGASKRQVEFFLALWVVNMLLPWFNFFLPAAWQSIDADGSYYWELCYFGGFLGYWILGYYLNRYPVRIGFNYKFVSLTVCCVVYPAVIFFIKYAGYEPGALTGNLQIGSAVLVAMLFVMGQNITLNSSVQHIVTKIAKYSYGIYLTHIYIARELYWGIFDGTEIHIFPRTFLIASLTLLTGYILSYLMTYLPKGRYVAGI